MTAYPTFKLAAVQAAPILFDREACVDKACRLIADAAHKGANLVAFGETWLGGYPFWIFSPPSDKWWKAAAEYFASAIEIPSPATDRLCASAAAAGVDVVIGVVELDRNTRGTLYCTLLFISHEGQIIGRHRKLKPTAWERTIWGEGDASGLRVHQRPYGRISGLNCWEHNMVLPGYALMMQGTQIHIAAWPGREPPAPPRDVPLWPRQLLLSRAFASQAGCYVVLVGGMRRPEDTPERYRDLAGFFHTGDSYLIDPRGEVIAGPAVGETILIGEFSLEAVFQAKSVCDVAGHYARPDILQLQVRSLRQPNDLQPECVDPIAIRAAASPAAASATTPTDAREPGSRQADTGPPPLSLGKGLPQ